MNSYYEKFSDGSIKCIEEEIPFDVPQGWIWCRLNHICELIEDCPHSTVPDEGEGYPLIRTPNIGFATLILDNVHRVCEATYNKRNERAVPKENDLIFAREAPAGNIAVIPAGEKVCLGQRTVLVRPMSPWVDPFYLAYYILAPSSQLSLVGQSTGTTVAHVNLADFRPYVVALPPLAEQKRIVNIIQKSLPSVEIYSHAQIQKNNLNETIGDRLYKSIIQEAIQGKLVSQESEDEPASVLIEYARNEKRELIKKGIIKKKDALDSIIFKGDDNKYYERIGGKVQDISDEITYDIPDSWCWARLSTIANLFTGNSINESEKKALYTNVSGKDYIGTKDIGFNSRIEYSNGVSIPDDYLTRFKIATSGSILLCVEGGSAGRKIAILEKDVCFGNKLCCVSPYVAISQYLFFYLQSPAFYDVFQKSKTGIIGGVSVNTLKDLIVAIPPIREQDRIVQKIKALSL